MKNLLISIFLLACCACSTMEFNSTGKEIFKVSSNGSFETKISVEVTKEFFFWGLAPKYAEFDLQDEMKGQDYNNPTNVTIEQRYTLKDIVLTFITLGLYCPVTYQVTLLSQGDVK